MSNSGLAMKRQFSSSQSDSSKSIQAELTQQERFNQKFLEAQEMIQDNQIDDAIKALRLLMEKINFMKQNRKEFDKKLELICLYNLAAAYQKQWTLDECIPLLEKFIALAKSCLQQNLKSSGSINLNEASTNKHWFKLKTLLCRAMLQYCAVLSQIGQHKKALKLAIQITSQLKTLFQRGLDECSRHIVKRQTAQAKKIYGKNGKTSIDKIQFSFSVLLSARQILQELSKLQTYGQINQNIQIQNEMQQVKSKIYYWKNIPENNIKTLRRSFSSSSQDEPQQIKKKNERNLLGIKRNQQWIQEFTIAKVMFMTPINYMQFCDNDNLIFEFNHRNLMEKIFLLSVSYFSLSIELRFLEEESNLDKKKSKNQKKQNKQCIDLQRSQIFHLKSIEAVCKHIKQNSAFVNHLVFNYHKHYKNNLNIIQEQNSLAQYSQLYDTKKKCSSKNEQENCLSNLLILPGSKRFRKDSIYYQEQIVPSSQPEKKVEQPIESISFKKPKKKLLGTIQDDKTEKQYKLKSSTSFSRRDQLNSKDKTLRKMGSCKMITMNKNQLQQLEKSEKSQSFKQISLRSIRQKSRSRNKNFLKSSVTLKQNQTSSPVKQRISKNKQIRDLKQSGDLRRDFAKKKSPDNLRPLDLLKKSGSLHDLSGKNLKESGNLYTSPSSGYRKKH